MKFSTTSAARLVATTALAALLAACGGGGDDSQITLAPLPQPVVTAAPESDATLTQVKSAFIALPGETVRATVFQVTCKGVTADGYCPGSWVQVGHLLFKSSVELQDAIFTWSDGTTMQGDFRSEGGGVYRFVPAGSSPSYIFQKGSLTVDVIVSAYAKAGDHTLLVLEAGTPAPDQKIEVKSESATLTVYEVATQAPMTITASEAYQPLVQNDKDRPFVDYTFEVSCVSGGCNFRIDFGWIRNLHPGSPIYICPMSGCRVTAYVDEDGYAALELQEYTNGNTSFTIRLFPDDEMVKGGWNYGLFADEVDSTINGTKIYPKIGTSTEPETRCTPFTQRKCKG